MVFPIFAHGESLEEIDPTIAMPMSGAEAVSIPLATFAVFASQAAGTIIGEPSTFVRAFEPTFACTCLPMTFAPLSPAYAVAMSKALLSHSFTSFL